jgi:hypothetical protein
MDERLNEEIDRMRRMTGWDIFERRDGHERGGFKFVIPGVMLGADDVAVDLDRESSEWVLTYQDSGRTWTGRGHDTVRAYLDLIADRCGFHEEETDESAE